MLAARGVGARRACERMIEEGRVAVNGTRVDRLPCFVDPAHDRITVDQKPLPRRALKDERRVYVMLHKPARMLTTAKDEPGLDRRTIAELVEHPGGRLFPIGRLDFHTSGLLLLTNDGDLAQRLTHPRYGVEKQYTVVVKGGLGAPDIERITRDIARVEKIAAKEIGKRPQSPVRIEVAKRGPGTTELRLILLERRSADLRKSFAAAGFPVRRLTRTGFGPLELTGLAAGMWRDLDRHEVRAIKSAARGDRPGVDSPVPTPRRRTAAAAPAEPAP